jgi:hypothetical protein
MVMDVSLLPTRPRRKMVRNTWKTIFTFSLQNIQPLLLLNKHDKSYRSPGPSCTFWAPERTHFAWNSYTAVYSSLCTLYTCSAPDQLFVLFSWSITGARLASVEVSLTILKTGDTTHQTEPYRSEYRVCPGLKTKWKALNISENFTIIITNTFKAFRSANEYLSQMIDQCTSKIWKQDGAGLKFSGKSIINGSSFTLITYDKTLTNW